MTTNDDDLVAGMTLEVCTGEAALTARLFLKGTRGTDDEVGRDGGGTDGTVAGVSGFSCLFLFLAGKAGTSCCGCFTCGFFFIGVTTAVTRGEGVGVKVCDWIVSSFGIFFLGSSTCCSLSFCLKVKGRTGGL